MRWLIDLGRRKHIPTGLAIVGVMLALTLVPASAAATSGPSFALQQVSSPSAKGYFIFRSKPGKVVHGQVAVTNKGTKSGAVDLFAVDATTGQTSGAVYRSRQESRIDVGRWLELDRARLTLSPGETVTVPFSAAVPEDALAGQHLGGIVAQNDTLGKGPTAKRRNGRFKINVQSLTVMAVQVNLPGPRAERMTVTGIDDGGSQGGHQTVNVGLANEGNVLVEPRLDVQVADANGHPLQHDRLQLDTFVPRTEIQYPVAVRGRALPPGNYYATVILTYGNHETVRYQQEFEVSSDQVTQVFGAGSPLAQQGSHSLMSYLPWALAAFFAVGFGYMKLRPRVRFDRSAK